jgi:CRP-like cAMP-binding protein
MSYNNRAMYARAVSGLLRSGAQPISVLDARAGEPGLVEKLSVLSHVEALKNLSAAAMSAMARVTSIADFEKGDVIYNLGEPIDSLCVVARGRVIASCFSSAGRALVKLIPRYGVFSELLVDSTKQGRSQVRAHVDTRLCRIAEAEFMRLSERYSALAIALARLMTERWTQTLQDLEDNVFLNARQRVLKLLDKLSSETHEEDRVGRGPLIEFSQDELARLTGVTRERMNCILRELENVGVIHIRPRALRIDSVKLGQAMIEEGLSYFLVEVPET